MKDLILIRLRIVFLTMIMFSCSKGPTIETFKNDLNGITKRVTDKKNKLLIDSLFDQTGNIYKVVEYYNELSHIKKSASYKNGLLDSTQAEYYYNGNLRRKKFYIKGVECFERIDYSESGKITEYFFLNSNQTNLYGRIYDTLGNCIGQRWEPFFESFIFPNDQLQFSIADTVTALFYAPHPPDCIAKLYTVYDNVEYENIKPLTEKFIYRVKIYPLRMGRFEWPVLFKLFDRKSDSLIYSSNLKILSFEVK